MKKVVPDSFVFDETKDLFPVDQFGFINAREAYASGVVSGSAPVSSEAFNEASYDSMLSRADDCFARDRQQQYVRRTLRAQAAADAASGSSSAE